MARDCSMEEACSVMSMQINSPEDCLIVLQGLVEQDAPALPEQLLGELLVVIVSKLQDVEPEAGTPSAHQRRTWQHASQQTSCDQDANSSDSAALLANRQWVLCLRILLAAVLDSTELLQDLLGSRLHTELLLRPQLGSALMYNLISTLPNHAAADAAAAARNHGTSHNSAAPASRAAMHTAVHGWYHHQLGMCDRDGTAPYDLQHLMQRGLQPSAADVLLVAATTCAVDDSAAGHNTSRDAMQDPAWQALVALCEAASVHQLGAILQAACLAMPGMSTWISTAAAQLLAFASATAYAWGADGLILSGASTPPGQPLGAVLGPLLASCTLLPSSALQQQLWGTAQMADAAAAAITPVPHNKIARVSQQEQQGQQQQQQGERGSGPFTPAAKATPTPLRSALKKQHPVPDLAALFLPGVNAGASPCSSAHSFQGVACWSHAALKLVSALAWLVSDEQGCQQQPPTHSHRYGGLQTVTAVPAWGMDPTRQGQGCSSRQQHVGRSGGGEGEAAALASIGKGVLSHILNELATSGTPLQLSVHWTAISMLLHDAVMAAAVQQVLQQNSPQRSSSTPAATQLLQLVDQEGLSEVLSVMWQRLGDLTEHLASQVPFFLAVAPMEAADLLLQLLQPLLPASLTLITTLMQTAADVACSTAQGLRGLQQAQSSTPSLNTTPAPKPPQMESITHHNSLPSMAAQHQRNSGPDVIQGVQRAEQRLLHTPSQQAGAACQTPAGTQRQQAANASPSTSCLTGSSTLMQGAASSCRSLFSECHSPSDTDPFTPTSRRQLTFPDLPHECEPSLSVASEMQQLEAGLQLALHIYFAVHHACQQAPWPVGGAGVELHTAACQVLQQLVNPWSVGPSWVKVARQHLLTCLQQQQQQCRHDSDADGMGGTGRVAHVQHRLLPTWWDDSSRDQPSNAACSESTNDLLALLQQHAAGLLVGLLTNQQQHTPDASGSRDRRRGSLQDLVCSSCTPPGGQAADPALAACQHQPAQQLGSNAGEAGTVGSGFKVGPRDKVIAACELATLLTSTLSEIDNTGQPATQAACAVASLLTAAVKHDTCAAADMDTPEPADECQRLLHACIQLRAQQHIASQGMQLLLQSAPAAVSQICSVGLRQMQLEYQADGLSEGGCPQIKQGRETSACHPGTPGNAPDKCQEQNVLLALLKAHAAAASSLSDLQAQVRAVRHATASGTQLKDPVQLQVVVTDDALYADMEQHQTAEQPAKLASDKSVTDTTQISAAEPVPEDGFFVRTVATSQTNTATVAAPASIQQVPGKNMQHEQAAVLLQRNGADVADDMQTASMQDAWLDMCRLPSWTVDATGCSQLVQLLLQQCVAGRAVALEAARKHPSLPSHLQPDPLAVHVLGQQQLYELLAYCLVRGMGGENSAAPRSAAAHTVAGMQDLARAAMLVLQEVAGLLQQFCCLGMTGISTAGNSSHSSTAAPTHAAMTSVLPCLPQLLTASNNSQEAGTVHAAVTAAAAALDVLAHTAPRWATWLSETFEQVPTGTFNRSTNTPFWDSLATTEQRCTSARAGLLLLQKEAARSVWSSVGRQAQQQPCLGTAVHLLLQVYASMPVLAAASNTHATGNSAVAQAHPGKVNKKLAASATATATAPHSMSDDQGTKEDAPASHDMLLALEVRHRLLPSYLALARSLVDVACSHTLPLSQACQHASGVTHDQPAAADQPGHGTANIGTDQHPQDGMVGAAPSDQDVDMDTAQAKEPAGAAAITGGDAGMAITVGATTAPTTPAAAQPLVVKRHRAAMSLGQICGGLARQMLTGTHSLPDLLGATQPILSPLMRIACSTSLPAEGSATACTSNAGKLGICMGSVSVVSAPTNSQPARNSSICEVDEEEVIEVVLLSSRLVAQVVRGQIMQPCSPRNTVPFTQSAEGDVEQWQGTTATSKGQLLCPLMLMRRIVGERPATARPILQAYAAAGVSGALPTASSHVAEAPGPRRTSRVRAAPNALAIKAATASGVSQQAGKSHGQERGLGFAAWAQQPGGLQPTLAASTLARLLTCLCRHLRQHMLALRTLQASQDHQQQGQHLHSYDGALSALDTSSIQPAWPSGHTPVSCTPVRPGPVKQLLAGGFHADTDALHPEVVLIACAGALNAAAWLAAAANTSNSPAGQQQQSKAVCLQADAHHRARLWHQAVTGLYQVLKVCSQACQDICLLLASVQQHCALAASAMPAHETATPSHAAAAAATSACATVPASQDNRLPRDPRRRGVQSYTSAGVRTCADQLPGDGHLARACALCALGMEAATVSTAVVADVLAAVGTGGVSASKDMHMLARQARTLQRCVDAFSAHQGALLSALQPQPEQAAVTSSQPADSTTPSRLDAAGTTHMSQCVHEQSSVYTSLTQRLQHILAVAIHRCASVPVSAGLPSAAATQVPHNAQAGVHNSTAAPDAALSGGTGAEGVIQPAVVPRRLHCALPHDILGDPLDLLQDFFFDMPDDKPQVPDNLPASEHQLEQQQQGQRGQQGSQKQGQQGSQQASWGSGSTQTAQAKQHSGSKKGTACSLPGRMEPASDQHAAAGLAKAGKQSKSVSTATATATLPAVRASKSTAGSKPITSAFLPCTSTQVTAKQRLQGAVGVAATLHEPQSQPAVSAPTSLQGAASGRGEQSAGPGCLQKATPRRSQANSMPAAHAHNSNSSGAAATAAEQTAVVSCPDMSLRQDHITTMPPPPARSRATKHHTQLDKAASSGSKALLAPGPMSKEGSSTNMDHLSPAAPCRNHVAAIVPTKTSAVEDTTQAAAGSPRAAAVGRLGSIAAAAAAAGRNAVAVAAAHTALAAVVLPAGVVAEQSGTAAAKHTSRPKAMPARQSCNSPKERQQVDVEDGVVLASAAQAASMQVDTISTSPARSRYNLRGAAQHQQHRDAAHATKPQTLTARRKRARADTPASLSQAVLQLSPCEPISTAVNSIKDKHNVPHGNRQPTRHVDAPANKLCDAAGMQDAVTTRQLHKAGGATAATQAVRSSSRLTAAAKAAAAAAAGTGASQETDTPLWLRSTLTAAQVLHSPPSSRIQPRRAVEKSSTGGPQAVDVAIASGPQVKTKASKAKKPRATQQQAQNSIPLLRPSYEPEARTAQAAPCTGTTQGQPAQKSLCSKAAVGSKRKRSEAPSPDTQPIACRPHKVAVAEGADFPAADSEQQHTEQALACRGARPTAKHTAVKDLKAQKAGAGASKNSKASSSGVVQLKRKAAASKGPQGLVSKPSKVVGAFEATPSNAPAGPAAYVNPFVDACLKERVSRRFGVKGRESSVQRPKKQKKKAASESSDDGSDGWSDLDDFIVCQPGRDYARLFTARFQDPTGHDAAAESDGESM